jgi:glutamine synthetase
MNCIEPLPEFRGSAYDSEFQLPRGLQQAIAEMLTATALHEVLGKRFVTLYAAVKEEEYAEFMKVISPWEREHLLLHV